jgi:TnsA endonuclease N terminal
MKVTLSPRDLKRIRNRRSTEFGKDYRPFIEVDEVRSDKSTSVRIKGFTVNRVHHLLSYHYESGAFEIFDSCKRVYDIREQLMLDHEKTLQLALDMGVKHPKIPTTEFIAVMTSDFHIRETRDGEYIENVYAIKPSSDLANERVLEKLELERRYWNETTIEGRRVHWSIVTEHEIPQALVENLRTLSASRDGIQLPSGIVFSVVRDALEESWEATLPMSRWFRKVDVRLRNPLGTALNVAFALIAQRIWRVNLLEKIDVDRPLKNLTGFQWEDTNGIQ